MITSLNKLKNHIERQISSSFFQPAYTAAKWEVIILLRMIAEKV